MLQGYRRENSSSFAIPVPSLLALTGPHTFTARSSSLTPPASSGFPPTHQRRSPSAHTPSLLGLALTITGLSAKIDGLDAVKASVPKLLLLSRCRRSVPPGTLAARRLVASSGTLHHRPDRSFRLSKAASPTTHASLSTPCRWIRSPWLGSPKAYHPFLPTQHLPGWAQVTRGRSGLPPQAQ